MVLIAEDRDSWGSYLGYLLLHPFLVVLPEIN